MSWTSYTDRLVASKVDLCAIHGKNGAPWAQVPKFTCSPDEVAKLVSAVCGNDQSLYSTGVQIAGKKWTVIVLDAEACVIVLKGKDADNTKQTLVLGVSTQAVVIGANGDENVQGSAVRIAVEALRDYLKQCGY